jgi:hypothetical protein
MERQRHYSLGEVARLLRRKQYHVTHVLTTGKVREPEQRIGNRRLFSSEDVLRLAQHFNVVPDWSATEVVPAAHEGEAQVGLALRAPFEVVTAGESCCEVKDADGEVFGWTSDRGRALVLAGLLEAAARG